MFDQKMDTLGQLGVVPVDMRNMSLRERLEGQKRRLEMQLKNVNEALECLDKNADFEKFHDAVTRAGY